MFSKIYTLVVLFFMGLNAFFLHLLAIDKNGKLVCFLLDCIVRINIPNRIYEYVVESDYIC